MRYMLDTNTCIHIVKYRPDSLYDRLSSLPVEDAGISSIVAAELWYGVALSQKKKQNEAALRDFFDYVEVIDWPSTASPVYGRIRALREKTRTPIGARDLLIATHALFLDSVLVTDNPREFERIEGLKIENWLER
jgi:tRNA(fMet)-specific endonuclease VapC